MPILVFIDKRGMIRSQYIGDETFLSHQETNIRAEIDKFLKGTAHNHIERRLAEDAEIVVRAVC